MEDAGHFPVMLGDVLELLAPADDETMVDCTIGLGGHAEALLSAAGGGARLIGIDLDESNLLKTKERLARFGPRVRLFRADFADLAAVLQEAGAASADVLLADLGMASTQVDDPARGFSFRTDGPLDMRFGGDRPTAADLVNRLGEDELAETIRRFGEDRRARRIARAIVRARRVEPIRRTARLARVVADAVGPARGRRRIHPATRTFQALRIAVNGELASLRRLLEQLPDRLSPAGRAAVISFHSLEDRLVKRSFASAAAAGACRRLTPRPRTPDDEELSRNPRSRSAKLRAIRRTG